MNVIVDSKRCGRLVRCGGSHLSLAVAGLMVFLFTGGIVSGVMEADVPDEVRERYLTHLHEQGILDIRTLVKAADKPNAINLVIVSAGFAENQKEEFYGYCKTLVKNLCVVPPWDRYKELLNFYAMFVPDESIDDTRLRVQAYKGGVMSCDNPIAVAYSRYAVDSDLTLVIHNSSFATPANGHWGVTVYNKPISANGRTVAHELGHGFAGLGDEYIQMRFAYPKGRDSFLHGTSVTSEPIPLLCQWHYWLDDSWHGALGPQKLPDKVLVTNPEGGAWEKKAYRSEENCIMRYGHDRFCVTCNEQVERSFFRYIDLFKTVEPANEDLVLWQGGHVDVRLRTIDLIAQSSDWLTSRLDLYVDGNKVVSSSDGEIAWRLSSEALAPGVHQMGVNLHVQAERVRRDSGYLSSNKGWRVTVLPYAKPRIVLDPMVKASGSDTIDVPVKLAHARPSLFTLTMANAPEGAVLENGRFKWKPSGQTGSWRVDFTAADAEQHGVTESMDIQITAAAGSVSSPVVVESMGPIHVDTGKPVSLPIKASAKDGGHLLFDADTTLEGVMLDRYTGVLSWTPQRNQGGPQRMRIRVKNGTASGEGDVVFFVRREATPTPIFGNAKQLTLETLEALRENPNTYRRLFEPLRLLRSHDREIAAKALAEANVMVEALDPKFRGNMLDELNMYAWSFTFKPEVLAWMHTVAAADTSEAAVRLQKTVDAINRYNTSRVERGLADEKRIEQERKEAMVGVVTNWQMSKIYAEANKTCKDLVEWVFPPEQGDAADAEWIEVETEGDGVLNFRRSLGAAKVEGPRENSAIYLRATLVVPVAVDARLEMGSDDSIKVFLNGKVVHTNPAMRGLKIGSDTQAVRLEPGTNRLLVKVLNGGGDWMAHVRVRNADGNPIPGLEIGLPQK